MINNIFNNKKAKLQKLIILLAIICLLILIPLGLNALDNSTSNEESISEQPLEEITDEIIEEPPVEEVPEETPNETEILQEEIMEINETIVEESINKTQIKTNETIIEEPAEESTNSKETIDSQTQPQLEIQLIYTKKITRGETISIQATITNIGNIEINNALINWQIPSGFEIISEDKKEKIKELLPNNSYVSKIQIQTSLNTSLGKNEIKIILK